MRATLDVEASVAGEGALISEPRYPRLARQLAVEGAVVFLAHVDRTGFVCQVAIVQGSRPASAGRQGR